MHCYHDTEAWLPVAQVASVLRYLGEHVTLLTSMNLRDYLYLKVRCLVQLLAQSDVCNDQCLHARPASSPMVYLRAVVDAQFARVSKR